MDMAMGNANQGTKQSEPVLEARGLRRSYGTVEALRGADFDLRRGEVLAVIGDNGAGKSTLIKCLSGATHPDSGKIRVDGKPVSLSSTQDARALGIETVYQSLAVSPALDIASNMYLGREIRKRGIFGAVFRTLDTKEMRSLAARQIEQLGIQTLQDITQPVETLSGGQRQSVAVARAATFGSKVLILDEPTAALGVRESAHVSDLIRKVRDSGIGVVLISHDMPMVFELADRIHVQRLGRRIALMRPFEYSMSDVVSVMTGAMEVPYPAGSSNERDKAPDNE